MRKIKIFDLNIASLVLRFYLMMAVVIIFSFLGQFTLAAVLGYILALSVILGASFRKETKKAVAKGKEQLRKVEQERVMKEAA